MRLGIRAVTLTHISGLFEIKYLAFLQHLFSINALALPWYLSVQAHCYLIPAYNAIDIIAYLYYATLSKVGLPGY